MHQLSPGVRQATMFQHHEECNNQHAVVPKWARANQAALEDTIKVTMNFKENCVTVQDL